MQNEKDALLVIYSGKGKPEFMPDAYSAHVKGVVFPGDRYFPVPFEPYGTGPDAWGVQWTNLGPDPGIDGSTVAAGFQLFDDFADWKDYVKFPDHAQIHAREILQGMMAGMNVNRDEDLVTVLMLSGQFERLNELCGMENALCAFYEEPELMHEWMDAMCEYKLKCIDLAIETVHPDMIIMHDDWGANNNMFFDPELWREFIKPNEKKYADRMHESGVLYRHHSCGYIMQIIPDLVEIGVDVLEPLMVSNDVQAVLKNYGDKITIAGGVDNQLIEGPKSSDEVIRNEARRVMQENFPLGRYYPDYVATSKEVRDKFLKYVMEYGNEILKR